jgi:3',5'-cyclic AMP phosphodiesterase CpdA
MIYAATLFFAVSTILCAEEHRSQGKSPDRAWTFVSMPDFLNVDTTYPQPAWEDALDYVLKAVKAENPDFVLVAGDLVMGRWSRAKRRLRSTQLFITQTGSSG